MTFITPMGYGCIATTSLVPLQGINVNLILSRRMECFYPEALKRSYWKKWPLIQFLFRKDINHADCLHVTCKPEMGMYANLDTVVP